MAIRPQNLDLNHNQMKSSKDIHLGDVTADKIFPIFVAPYHCKVETIDLYNFTDVTENTSQSVTVTYHLMGAPTSTLGSITTAISACAQNRISCSSHNSLTAGSVVLANFSATCQVLSAVTISVRYVPSRHRER